MKKNFCLTAALMTVLMMMAVSPACLADSQLVGDVNQDGKITSTDMLMLKEHIVETRTLTGQSGQNADINGDGNINSTDVAQLNRMLLSDVEFPVSGMITFPYEGNRYTLSYEPVQYGITSPMYTISGFTHGKVLVMPAHQSGMYLTVYSEEGYLDLFFFGYNGEVLWGKEGFFGKTEVVDGAMKQFYVGNDVWFILVQGSITYSKTDAQYTCRFRYQDAYPTY